MSGHPAGPDFSAVKQPTFDDLVAAQVRVHPQLEDLAKELWTLLRRLGVDPSPARRIDSLGTTIRRQAGQLVDRQREVKRMEHAAGPYGAPLPRPTAADGTYWVGTPDVTPDNEDSALSFELGDAYALGMPRVDPYGLRFSRREAAVLAWVERYQADIRQQAEQYGIPPEAIVAAIAWEAMDNVHSPLVQGAAQGLGAASARGPGKVHFDGDLARQTERRGYLPQLTDEQRAKALATDTGSIRYIAATMRALADASRNSGGDAYDIRNNVPLLLQAYQQYDVEGWERQVRDQARTGQPLTPGNPMAVWAQRNPALLAAAVWDGTGPPPALESSQRAR
jgi:hypothetical protein